MYSTKGATLCASVIASPPPIRVIIVVASDIEHDVPIIDLRVKKAVGLNWSGIR